MTHPFTFVTSLKLTEITGRRARTVGELLDGIRTLDGSVIFNHTHHFLLKYQYWLSQPPSGFAFWVSDVLQEKELGEALASVDTIGFRSIRQLREELVRILESHLTETGRDPGCPPGQEFHFLRAHSFIFPTRHRATDLEEFLETLRKVSLNSIYHHVFESRLRLERESNDFSLWLRSELGEQGIADRIDRLDPYVFSLSQLRDRLYDMIRRRLDGNG